MNLPLSDTIDITFSYDPPAEPVLWSLPRHTLEVETWKYLVTNSRGHHPGGIGGSERVGRGDEKKQIDGKAFVLSDRTWLHDPPNFQ